MIDRFFVVLCGLTQIEELEIRSYFEEEPPVILKLVEDATEWDNRNVIYYNGDGVISSADLVIFKIFTNDQKVLNEKHCHRFRIPFLIIDKNTDIDFVKEEISTHYIDWVEEWNQDFME